MEEEKALRQKVLDYRKSKGLTQEEMAELLDVSVSTISRIESGTISPNGRSVRICLQKIESLLAFEGKPGDVPDERIYYNIEENLGELVLKDLDALYELSRNDEKIEEIYKSIKLFWEIICTYRFMNEGIKDEDLKTKADILKGFINGGKEMSKRYLLLKNAYSGLVLKMGMPKEAEDNLKDLLKVLENKSSLMEWEHKSLAAIYNNISYISLSRGFLEKSRVYLRKAWEEARYCSSVKILKAILLNHAEICNLEKDSEGRIRDTVALDAIELINNIIPGGFGDEKIERYILTF